MTKILMSHHQKSKPSIFKDFKLSVFFEYSGTSGFLGLLNIDFEIVILNDSEGIFDNRFNCTIEYVYTFVTPTLVTPNYITEIKLTLEIK